MGWALSGRITDELTLDALGLALARRRPPPGLLHHSDRGSQYASGDYQRVLAQHGIVCSMSRRGNCWDNAVAESFFASLKVELVHGATWATRAAAHTRSTGNLTQVSTKPRQVHFRVIRCTVSSCLRNAVGDDEAELCRRLRGRPLPEDVNVAYAPSGRTIPLFLTIQDPVGRMGIRRDGLYDTFGDKRALFFAAIDRYGCVVSAKLLAALKATVKVTSGPSSDRAYGRVSVIVRVTLPSSV